MQRGLIIWKAILDKSGQDFSTQGKILFFILRPSQLKISYFMSRFLSKVENFFFMLRLFTLSRDILCSDVSIQVDSRLELKDVNFMLLQHETGVNSHRTEASES